MLKAPLSFLIIFVKIGFAQDLDLELQRHRNQYMAETKGRFPKAKQDFYPASTSMKIEATYAKPELPKTISLPTSGTKTKDYTIFALVRFKINGQTQSLNAYQPLGVSALYKSLIFVPFKDLTGPNETYGGGRYLDMDMADFKNGKVIIDFNRAYNPYCAFSDGWNCPIPPLENQLSIRIDAGEKKPLNDRH
jgi:uncharacterized protein